MNLLYGSELGSYDRDLVRRGAFFAYDSDSLSGQFAQADVDVDGDGEANPGRSGVLDARTRDSCGKEAGAAVTDGGQAVITGPHMEPPEVSNATTFWRCSECGRESIREQDVYRTTFHAEGCAGSEGR